MRNTAIFENLSKRERDRLSSLADLARQPALVDTSEVVVYLRQASGNDDRDGLTEAHAVATLPRALELMGSLTAKRTILEITGETLADDSLLQIGAWQLGGIVTALNVNPLAPPANFVSYQPRQMRAEPALIMDLTVTAQAEDAVSGFVTLTVDETLTTNQLRGKMIIGQGLAEWGRVRSNGTHTIELAAIGTFASMEGIAAYSPGATIRYGAGDGQDQCVYLNALCGWSFQGISFETYGTEASALTIWPHAKVDLTLCDIEGLVVNTGGGVVSIDACYIHDGTFAQDGGAIALYDSLFRNVSFANHGSGDSGLNEWTGFAIDNCNAFGTGNAESRWQVQAANFEIDGSSSHGVHLLFGKSTFTDGRVDNSTSSAFFVDPLCHVVLNNVTGTGSARYGIECPRGPARFVAKGGTDVTGTLGNTLCGSTGGVKTYAQLPSTDGTELVVGGVL